MEEVNTVKNIREQDGKLTTMDQVITTRNESINKIMLRLPELYVCDTDELTTVQRRITCRDQAFNMALEKFPLSPELHVTIELKDETLLFIGKTNYCNEIYREFQNWLCFYKNILPDGGSEVCAVLIENDVWKFFKDVMADELMKLVDDRNYTLESVTPTSPPNAAEKRCNIYLSARHPNIKNNDHLDQIKLFVRTWLRRIEFQKFLYTKEPKDEILLSGLAEVKCMYCSLRVEETETELIFWGPRPIPSQAMDLFLLLIGQDKALKHILEVSARLNNRPILINVDLNVWLYVESVLLKLHGMPFSDLKFTAQQEDDDTENCFVLCRGRRLNENEERRIRRMYQDAFNKVSLVTYEHKSYTTTPQECNLALEEIKCMYSSLLVRETDDEIIFIAIASQPQKAMSDFKKLLGVKNAASKSDIAGNKKSTFPWGRKKSTEVAEVSKTTVQLDKRRLSIGEPLKWRANQIYEKRPSQIAKKTSGATESSLVPK